MQVRTKQEVESSKVKRGRNFSRVNNLEDLDVKLGDKLNEKEILGKSRSNKYRGTRIKNTLKSKVRRVNDGNEMEREQN